MIYLPGNPFLLNSLISPSFRFELTSGSSILKRPEWAVTRRSCEAEGPLGLSWPLVATPADLAELGTAQRAPDPSRPRGGTSWTWLHTL